ncbi:unnamed protein product [Effrenium voratum]|uniref:OTU domain-containing protein n=1 Tax=Effrenium voratum TaxID=2562239 RepID=A0AA36I290_9DINO|nr:unnamed protein product [Effrenium voratum]
MRICGVQPMQRFWASSGRSELQRSSGSLTARCAPVGARTGALLKTSAGTGLLVFAGRCCAWRSQRRSKPSARPCVTNAQEVATCTGTCRSRQMNDKEILDNLNERRGWKVKDMGANGNCLFLSMATQVRKEDVYDLPARSPAWAEALGDLSRWEDLSIRDRASLLRRMAILDEAEFIAEVAALRARGEQLRAPLMWRLEELFTDMAEEFVSSNQTELAANIPGWDRQGLYSRVREVVSSFTLDQKCEFVLLHADEYMQTTGREGNWAGSSEMAALSSVLHRPVQAFGNNWVSQDDVKIMEPEAGSSKWEVLPYFEARCFNEPRGDPIRVFQTHGGGHYQMLT